jgi:hypothetical protein
MREISRLPPSDEKWTAKFAVFKENIEHHVEGEEGEIWAKAREILNEAEAAARRGIRGREGEITR